MQCKFCLLKMFKLTLSTPISTRCHTSLANRVEFFLKFYVERFQCTKHTRVNENGKKCFGLMCVCVCMSAVFFHSEVNFFRSSFHASVCTSAHSFNQHTVLRTAKAATSNGLHISYIMLLPLPLIPPQVHIHSPSVCSISHPELCLTLSLSFLPYAP